MLGNSSGLAGYNVCFPYIIQKGRFSMVNMAHYRHNRRSGQKIFRCVFGNSLFIGITSTFLAVALGTMAAYAFAFLEWRPVAQLAIVPSLDIEDKRWLQNAVNNTVYYRGGSLSLLNLKAAYQFLPGASFEVGTTNTTDRNYVIEDGYHAPGRQYFATLRLTF